MLTFSHWTLFEMLGGKMCLNLHNVIEVYVGHFLLL